MSPIKKIVYSVQETGKKMLKEWASSSVVEVNLKE